MKLLNIYNSLFVGLIIALFCMVSCKKNIDSATNENGLPVPVKINISGLERTLVPTQISSKSSVGTSNANNKTSRIDIDKEIIQKKVIPFDEKFSIIATLTLENGTAMETRASSSKVNSNKLSLGPDRTNLEDGIMYGIAVYNNDGSYKDHKTFAYSTKSIQNDFFMLDGGKEYIFVAYSLNSKTTLPTFVGKDISHEQAKLTNIDGDLMYFQKRMKITGNETNYLDVIFRHQYCQITTKLDATVSNLGNITAVNAFFSPIFGTDGLQIMLKDSLLSTKNTAASKAIEFATDALNRTVVTSKPTLLISNNTESAKFNIASITIGGVTKTNINLDGIRIVRGGRYNLNLTVAKDPFNGQKLKILAFNPDRSGQSGSYNLATGTYASVAKSKLQNLDNFGPKGKVVVPGFEFDVLDWSSLAANNPDFVKNKLAWADIIWIGSSDYWMSSIGMSPNKPIELVMRALSDKKKFGFFMNDYSALAIQFPISTFPAGGFSTQFISGLPSTSTRPLTLVEGVGPNSGPFGTVKGTMTVYDKGGYIHSPEIPGSGNNSAKIFMKNPAGYGIPNTITNNAMVYDNIIVVGDQEWMLNSPPNIAVPRYGLYGGTNIAGESKESIIFCNMFAIAVEYLRARK